MQARKKRASVEETVQLGSKIAEAVKELTPDALSTDRQEAMKSAYFLLFGADAYADLIGKPPANPFLNT